MSDQDERHLLTGAYALGALGEDDKAGFEVHLAESEAARAEVASLSDTAVQLGLATRPVAPSPQLKANLMAAIRTTPQLPAAVEALSLVNADSPVAPVETTPGSSSERRAQARWFARPASILIAAAAAVALFVGGTVVGLATANNGIQQVQLAQAASLAELTSADDVQRAHSSVAGGGQATLIWSLQLRRSAVLIDKLPALPAGKTYQLWYIDAAGAKSAGTFEAAGPDSAGTDKTGKTWAVLDGKMSGGDTVGITVEPEGGSAQPTTKPIVAIASA